MLWNLYENDTVEATWGDFVHLFKIKYILELVQDKMEQDFFSLTQGSMTILEYEARFAELSRYAPHIMIDERRKVKKFVMDLRPSLRTRLVAFNHQSIEEVLSAACRQESEMDQYQEEKKALMKRPSSTYQCQDFKKKKSFAQPSDFTPLKISAPQVSGSRESIGDKAECKFCGKRHGGKECWMMTGKCLRCGSPDHKIKDCPKV